MAGCAARRRRQRSRSFRDAADLLVEIQPDKADADIAEMACAWRTPAFAIGTSAPSIAGSSPISRRCSDSAADTAASTPMVTVGLRSWEPCRITVRILRTPAGRVLVRPWPVSAWWRHAGTRPAAVSRSSCRWARAAVNGAGSGGPRNADAPATAYTTGGAAEQRRQWRESMPPSVCTACNTATVPAPGCARTRRPAWKTMQPPGHYAGVEPITASRPTAPDIRTSRRRRDRAPRTGAHRPRRAPTPVVSAAAGPAPAAAARQPRARSRTTQRLLNIGWHARESVQQERVVGDLGRHPVRLRVDRRHPAQRHCLTKSRMCRATVSAVRVVGKCPACSLASWPSLAGRGTR